MSIRVNQQKNQIIYNMTNSQTESENGSISEETIEDYRPDKDYHRNNETIEEIDNNGNVKNNTIEDDQDVEIEVLKINIDDNNIKNKVNLGDIVHWQRLINNFKILSVNFY